MNCQQGNGMGLVRVVLDEESSGVKSGASCALCKVDVLQKRTWTSRSSSRGS